MRSSLCEHRVHTHQITHFPFSSSFLLTISGQVQIDSNLKQVTILKTIICIHSELYSLQMLPGFFVTWYRQSNYYHCPYTLKIILKLRRYREIAQITKLIEVMARLKPRCPYSKDRALYHSVLLLADEWAQGEQEQIDEGQIHGRR